MTPDEIRKEIRETQRFSHEICSEPLPGETELDPELVAYLGRIDRATTALTELPDLELVSSYERFVRERAVVSWVHDEVQFLKGDDLRAKYRDVTS